MNKKEKTYKVLLPNRSLIQSCKNFLLKEKGGFIGLDFLTFDDLAQLYSFKENKDLEEIVVYILQKKLIEKKEEFPTIGDSFSFIGSIRIFIEFFDQCIRANLKEEDFNELPYTYNKEVYRAFVTYEKLLIQLEALNVEHFYQIAKSNISKGIFPRENLLIFGFSGFRTMEIDLLKAMNTAYFGIEMHLDYNQEDRNPYFERSIEEISQMGFQILEEKSKLENQIDHLLYTFSSPLKYKNTNIQCIQSQRETVLLEEIFNQIGDALHEGYQLEDMAILTKDKEEKRKLSQLAQLYKVPLSNPLNSIDINNSQLLQEIETLLEYREEGKRGIIDRLSLNLFPLFSHCQEFIQILNPFDFEDYKEFSQTLKKKANLPISEEEAKLLFYGMEILSHDYFNLYRENFLEQCNYLQEILMDLDPNKLKGQDPFILNHLMEIIEEVKKYSLYLQDFSPKDFFQILLSILERKEAEEEEKGKGLSIVTLQEGFALDFTWLAFYNMDSSFPQEKEENFLKNRRTLPKLYALNLYKDEKFRKDIEILMFLQALSGKKKVYLLHGGQEEDLSPLWIQIRNKLEDREDKRISQYHLEESYPWTRAHRSQENYGALWQAESVDKIELNLSKKTYTASFIDSYVSCPFKTLARYFFLAEEESLNKKQEENFAKGNIYHKVLERYYSQKSKDKNLEDIFLEVADQSQYHDIFDPMEYPIIKRSLLEKLRKFILADEERMENVKKDKGFAPYFLEETFYFNLAGLNWRGTIDRIDVNNKGQEILIDYKKSQGASVTEFNQGQTWQLALYGYARYLQGKNVVGLSYGNIEKGNFRVILRNSQEAGDYSRADKSQLITSQEMEEFFHTLPQRLEEILNRLEAGDFQAIPIDKTRCNTCTFLDICRKEEVD